MVIILKEFVVAKDFSFNFLVQSDTMFLAVALTVARVQNIQRRSHRSNIYWCAIWLLKIVALFFIINCHFKTYVIYIHIFHVFGTYINKRKIYFLFWILLNYRVYFLDLRNAFILTANFEYKLQHPLLFSISSKQRHCYCRNDQQYALICTTPLFCAGTQAT
jgi:hypothetical protein